MYVNLKVITFKCFSENRFLILSKSNKDKLYFDMKYDFIKVNKKIDIKEEK